MDDLMNPGLFVRNPSQTARAKIGEGAMDGSDVAASTLVVPAAGATTSPANVPVQTWHVCIQWPVAGQSSLTQWCDGWTQSGAGTRCGP